MNTKTNIGLKYNITLRRSHLNIFKGILAVCLGGLLTLTSCNSDDVGGNIYTFTGERMGEYMQKRPSQFSEFVKMLDTTEVMGLLNAYGSYTCFAPTNDALKAFYKLKGRSSIDEFPLDSIKIIVYNHIIKGSTITSEDFPEGRLSQMTMSNRYLSTTFAGFASGEQVIKVNNTSPIIEADIEVHNGMIHVISEVVKPTDKTLLMAIESDPKFKLFYKALVETELYKKLELIEDKTYNKNSYSYPSAHVQRLGLWMELPDFRKYGYTAFIESDSVYRINGIETIDDLKAKAKEIYDVVYPKDAGITDVTNPKNSFNRFVAYHLINKQLSYDKLIKAYDTDVYATNILYDSYEYIETMCPNTLLEVRTLRTSSKTNLLNYINASGEYISINESYYDKDAVNGVYHELNGLLSYNINIASEIASKRLRLDVASFFPELTNNNMRGRGTASAIRYILPTGYVERLEISKETEFQYFTAYDPLGTFQSDEFNSIVASLYDITITTLPIPAGTYEVRIGYQPNNARGAAQLYWDDQPCGIPLDIRLAADDPGIGYVTPGEDASDLEGLENDKMMRNRGYMKGPSSFRLGSWYTAPSARMSKNYLRRILGIYNFKEDGVHKFRAEAARSGQFQLDFIEFTPTEILDKEGID